jgi:aryl-alcohol dehydrogenase-like predicted oxidoreductase
MANSDPTYGSHRSATLTSETLEAMWGKGLRRVDFAEGYQFADALLERSGLSWEVQTKVRIEKESISHESLRGLVEKSTTKKNIRALLIHNPEFAYFSNASRILEELKEISLEFGINKIGISIYRPYELAAVKDWELIEIVQFPHNPFDSSCLEWLTKNPPNSTPTLQARSIFMQGLLVTQPDHKRDLPEELLQEIRQWHNWLSHREGSATRFCVDYAVSNEKLDEIVIGIDTISHGTEILAYISEAQGLETYQHGIDSSITDPRRWNN